MMLSAFCHLLDPMLYSIHFSFLFILKLVFCNILISSPPCNAYIFICLWQHYILSKRRQYTFLKTERHHIHKQHITNTMTSIRWNRVLQASGGLQCYDIHSSDSCYWQMTFHSILVLLHLLNGYIIKNKCNYRIS